jgi:Co/Zn/Cd efflux system component
MRPTCFGGIALALFASWIKPANRERTYGYYRAEILAAMINAVVLFGVSFWILFEAWGRFREPPSVSSLPMLAVAAVGLVINLIAMRMLRHSELHEVTCRARAEICDACAKMCYQAPGDSELGRALPPLRRLVPQTPRVTRLIPGQGKRRARVLSHPAQRSTRARQPCAEHSSQPSALRAASAAGLLAA